MRMRRNWWNAARALSAVAILAVLIWRVGTGPFRDAIGMINGWSVGAAVIIAAVTTTCCAWRWSLVARGLGVGVPLPVAIASYYRSQFINTALPGGILGDVHRGVRHGRDAGDLGRGLRAVAWERFSGQFVQVVLTLILLLLLPSPVQSSIPIVAAAVLAGALLILVLLRVLPSRGASGRARFMRAVTGDVRNGLLARRIWPGAVLASAVALAGHTATFLIAARTVGVTAPTLRLLPLALLVLLAAAVPTNIGGWGPREGVAAASFSVAGLGAAQGVAVSVVYGVLALIAGLPGAVVLIVGSLRERARETGRPEMVRTPPAATIRTQVVLPLRFPDGYATSARVFSFEGLTDGREHLAIGLGDFAGALRATGSSGPAPLVRPHSECLTGDVFGSQRCDCGPQMREAVERIAEAGGFLLYLRQEGRGIGLYAKLDAYALQDAGLDTYEANVALGYAEDERDYTVAAQMMHALGLTRVALLTNNPDKAAQLAELGVTVTECVPTGMHLSAANSSYLAAKATRGGHTLNAPALGRARRAAE